MNPAGIKFTTLFLIFSLLMLSINLYAKERRGATLVITERDGRLIEGELIAVKPNSLLLLDAEGKDVSVGIEEIEVIRVAKKSAVWESALFGLLAGIAIGVASFKENNYIIFFSAPVGLIIAGVTSALAGIDEIIQIGGRPESAIEFYIDKLRKKARIRDDK